MPTSSNPRARLIEISQTFALRHLRHAERALRVARLAKAAGPAGAEEFRNAIGRVRHHREQWNGHRSYAFRWSNDLRVMAPDGPPVKASHARRFPCLVPSWRRCIPLENDL